jgi:3-oxoacyl-[acyl-carrier-protein] synthase II
MSLPVAVTGIGVLSVAGCGADAFWNGLCAGTAPASDRLTLDVAATVRTPQGRRIDRASLMALAAARDALAHAGLDAEALPAGRSGIALGSAFGNVTETQTFLDRLLARGAGNPLVFPNLVMNAELSYATIELGTTGPSAMLTEQEASGEAAVAWGAQQVADGALEVCLAGGADEVTDELLRIERETRIASPMGVARPLDRDADGIRRAEGASVLVLEPLERARARGARIWALVEPHAGASVPSPVHGWPSDAAALAAVFAPLVADADVVVAAASGAPALDAVEAEALARALAGRATPITAPRGVTGHFGAAGALAVATAALAIAHGAVPPTAGCRTPRHAALSVVRDTVLRRPLRTAVVDGLARGGLCRPLRLRAA